MEPRNTNIEFIIYYYYAVKLATRYAESNATQERRYFFSLLGTLSRLHGTRLVV